MKTFIILTTLLLVQSTQLQAGSPPVGTQFTYQAELLDNGSPANGEYDLVFRLFTDATGGLAIDLMALDNVVINQGLINANLDFGDLTFAGDQRYIEVSIRPSNSGDPFTALSPRSRINVTPYAIQAAFVENDSNPWVQLGDGITYGNKVYVGNATASNALMTVNSATGQTPFRVRISSGSKFTVFENGGATIGTNGQAPADGLLLQGPAHQGLSAHGFVKAAAVIGCGTGINGGSQRFFNNVNGSDFTSNANGASGGCLITVPFDISDAFVTVSAHESGGVAPFQTAVASCAPASSTELACQVHLIQGATTSLSNGILQLMVY